jgi:hypothetical protein
MSRRRSCPTIPINVCKPIPHTIYKETGCPILRPPLARTPQFPAKFPLPPRGPFWTLGNLRVLGPRSRDPSFRPPCCWDFLPWGWVSALLIFAHVFLRWPRDRCRLMAAKILRGGGATRECSLFLLSVRALARVPGGLFQSQTGHPKIETHNRQGDGLSTNGKTKEFQRPTHAEPMSTPGIGSPDYQPRVMWHVTVYCVWRCHF